MFSTCRLKFLKYLGWSSGFLRVKGKTSILLHQTKDFGIVIPDFRPRSLQVSQGRAACAVGSEGCRAERIQVPAPPGSICPRILHSCRLFLQLLLKITEARRAPVAAPAPLLCSSSSCAAKRPGLSRNLRPCFSPPAPSRWQDTQVELA